VCYERLYELVREEVYPSISTAIVNNDIIAGYVVFLKKAPSG
jgi:hypothetical protein